MRFSYVQAHKWPEAPDVAEYRALLGCPTPTLWGPPVHFGARWVREAARVFLCCGDSPPRYSITSSARASRVGGTSRPSKLAVLRLMINKNLVGKATGRWAGLA